MAWKWRAPQGQHSKGGFATRDQAVAHAVGCAIAMQKGKKPGVVMEEPTQEQIDLLWPSLKRAGWCVYAEDG